MSQPTPVASRSQIGEAAELRYHIAKGVVRKLLHSIVHSADPPTKKHGPNPFQDYNGKKDPLADVVLRAARRLVTDIVPSDSKIVPQKSVPDGHSNLNIHFKRK